MVELMVRLASAIIVNGERTEMNTVGWSSYMLLDFATSPTRNGGVEWAAATHLVQQGARPEALVLGNELAVAAPELGRERCAPAGVSGSVVV